MQVIIYYDDGYRYAIEIKAGHKFRHIIPMDGSGIRLKKIPSTDPITPIKYSVERAKRIFRIAAKRFGSTKSARALLRAEKRPDGTG